MGKLLALVVRFLLEKMRWLIVIILVLLAGSWLHHEWQQLAQAEQDKLTLQSQQQILQRRYQQLVTTQQQLIQTTQKLTQDVARAAKKYTDLQKQLQQLRLQRQQLWDDNWLARKNPLSEVSLQLQMYDAQIAAISTQLALAQRLHQDWQRQVNQSPEMQKSRELAAQIKHTQGHLHTIEQSIQHKDQQLQASWVQKLRVSIGAVLPTAVLILLALMLTPLAFKVVMYFVIAPWVSRLRAIHLIPEAHNSPIPVALLTADSQGQVSSNRLSVTLQPEQELLIHPDYLQSYSRQARKSTRWLLNARLPFTSLAAGLFTLVKVQSEQPEIIQLASSRQVHSELLLLDLPAGAMLVCKPHGLVGVIKTRTDDIKMTKHWRIFSMHAWLTLQFRFLVFHGACQLLIKGNRGVMLEPVGEPRLIQQAATLAFSAQAAYANYRCETFVSYYLGKDSLFNDQFSGESGIYVYEQIPDSRQQQDWFSRAWGGVWDAVLKVFGI